jgi:hypothetical protein
LSFSERGNSALEQASEIAKLRVGDVRTELARPQIRIRNGASKGGRPRIVPLW